MRFVIDKNPTNLTISEFYDNYQANKYHLDVGYQRESDIWSDDAKSFLIDSIMKNYPIPSILLNPKLGATGKTEYDVVDGKQRLKTIIDFIENKIPLTSYFADDEIFDKETEELAKQIEGKMFKDLQTKDKKYDIFVRQFWTYKLNLDMLYEDNYDIVSTIFDRLNRNGSPLNKQELRHAKYGNTSLYKLIETLAKDTFWDDKLKKTTRMQNIEFISELFFTSLAGKVITTTYVELDKLYDQYHKQNDFDSFEEEYNKIMGVLKSLPINYEKYRRICSTTHLYSLFSLAQSISNNTAKIDDKKINNFYNDYFYNYDENNNCLKNYYTASSNGTHSLKCRQTRLEALTKYCQNKYI